MNQFDEQRGGYKAGQQAATRQRVQERQDHQERPDFRQEARAAQNDRSAFQNAAPRQQERQGPPSAPASPPADLPGFEILNLRRLQPGGATVAFFSVAVHVGGFSKDPLMLHDCKLIVSRDGEPFIGLPQREWTDREGVKKYSPLTEMPKSWRGPLLDTVIDVLGGWPLPPMPTETEQEYRGN